MDGAPLSRPGARGLVIDANDRILLFRGKLPGRRGWWFAPGGAVEHGESHAEALVRELDEEIGLLLPPNHLLGPVWARTFLFEWKGATERHEELFFLIRLDAHDVATTGWTDDEERVLRAHRWWSVDEITASREEFSPRDLAELLQPLLSGTIPSSPLIVGA